jgi:hypothetical protein
MTGDTGCSGRIYQSHSDAEFTTVFPDCKKKLYPDMCIIIIVKVNSEKNKTSN